MKSRRILAVAAGLAALLLAACSGSGGSGSGSSGGKPQSGRRRHVRRAARLDADVHLPALQRGQLGQRRHHLPAAAHVAAAVLVRPPRQRAGHDRLQAEHGQPAGVLRRRPDRHDDAEELQMVQRQAGHGARPRVLDEPAAGREEQQRGLRPWRLDGSRGRHVRAVAAHVRAKFNVTYNQSTCSTTACRSCSRSRRPSGTRPRPPARSATTTRPRPAPRGLQLPEQGVDVAVDLGHQPAVAGGRRAWHLKPNTGFQVTGQTIMVPNKSYSGPDKPKISEFEELPFTSATAEFNALQSGSVDYGYVPDTEVGALRQPQVAGLLHQALVRVGADVHRDQLQQPQVRPAGEPALHPAGDAAPHQPARVHQGDPAQLRHTDLRPGADVPGEQFPRPGREHQPVPVQHVRGRAAAHRPRLDDPQGRDRHLHPARDGQHECGAGIASGTKLSIPLLYTSGIPELQTRSRPCRRPSARAASSCSCARAPVNTVLSEAYECIGKSTSSVPGQLDGAEPHRVAGLHLRADLLPRRGQPVRLRRRHQRRQLCNTAGGRR